MEGALECGQFKLSKKQIGVLVMNITAGADWLMEQKTNIES